MSSELSVKKCGYLVSASTILLICCYAHVTNASGQAVNLVEKELPSVYLKYDRTEDRESRCIGEGGKQVVLQLHNNTNTNINVGANFNIRFSSMYIGTGKTSDGTSIEFLRSGSDVELCYDVESLFTEKNYDLPKRRSTPTRRTPICSCTYRFNGGSVDQIFVKGFWIKPGTFIRFAVPERFLKNNYKVLTAFNYPWEYERGVLRQNEAQHRVYFYYFDLPNYLD
jgi:hypothetical protein